MDVLLNWLTQGAIVAFATAAGLRVMPRSRAQARYAVVWAACLVVLALPAISHILAATAVPVTTEPAVLVARDRAVVSIPNAWWTSPACVLVLCVIWSAAHASRLIAGGVRLRQARRACRPCAAALTEHLPHWSRVRTIGRQAPLMLSRDVRAAAVLGGGPPIIAVAPVLIERLSAADLDRVVIHEWAHVQRRDDVAQCVQMLVHLIAGWHPAIRWLERQLAYEREVACDQTAVAAAGNAKAYAACLVRLAELPAARHRSLPALAAAASNVHRRVTHILAAHSMAHAPRWRALALCGALALGALAIILGGVRVAVRDATSRVAVAPLASKTAMTPSTILSAPPPSQAGRRARSPSAGSRLPARQQPRRRIVSLDDVTGEWPTARAEASVGRAPEPARDVAIASPLPTAAPSDAPAESRIIAPLASAPLRADGASATPWTAVAGAGVAVGRGSQQAAVATAGFFSRFGKSIAGSF